MLLLIGGLSGAGKTALGKYLAKNTDFHWVELDGGERGRDEVTEWKIRAEWEQFLKGDPNALGGRFPDKTVFTIPSFPIIKAPLYSDSTKVRIRYLTGPKELCFARANARSGVTQEDWDNNNADLLAYFAQDCPTKWKLPVFTDAGEVRSPAELADAVMA